LQLTFIAVAWLHVLTRNWDGRTERRKFMTWLTANWFWVLIFIAFIGMHMFCHGGHGTHTGHA